MGAAASTNIGSLVPSEHDDIENQHDHFEEAGDSKEAHVIVRENSSMGGPAANSRSKPLRQRIFDKVSLDNLAGDAANTKNVVVDEATRELLSNAFSGFYFLQSNSSDSKTNEKLEIVMRAMEKEEIDENVRLITEGESGDRLYVVESGELEVTINGEVIRTLKRSNIVGELSLLYDAPRTATVRSITKVVVWSLKREVFKRIQAMSASAAYNERARWLINCPELAVLSAIDRSRLVGILKMHHFAEGEQLYKEGEMSHSIILVEKGTADFVMKTEPHDVVDMDNYLGITRPARRNSVNSVSERKSLSQNIVKEADGFHVCNVGVGCILGMGILRSKAGMEDPWEWATRGGHEGAISPYSVVAKSEMQCWTFDVDVFENLFGNVSKVLQPKKNTIERSGSVHRQSAEKKIEEKKFDYWKFKKLFLLGSGTFGIVTLAEYRDTNDSPPMLVALKSLSKQAVIETGQLRHVLDERRLLAAMDSNFILKVYGTTQTSDQLIMVTEPLDGGDLWSVIYEVPQYVESNGLPPGLARFYAASIILALSHIHEQGVAYRDLKPENVMLDSKGRLRMIDFGFAKKVPYSKVNPETGEEKIYHKTYTLCGTPEYLSPELIFNLGHDQSSDLWAFGVLLHEMFVAVTPFAPKKADNVTELFTNIAMVKKNGLKLMPRLAQKDAQANSLVQMLLKAEPVERIGIASGSTRSILEHEFFSSVDVEGISKGDVVPEYIPDGNANHEPISNIPPVKPYTGDQNLFKDF